MRGLNYADPTALKLDLAKQAYDVLLDTVGSNNLSKIKHLDPTCENNGHIIDLKLLSINTFLAILAAKVAAGTDLVDAVDEVEFGQC